MLFLSIRYVLTVQTYFNIVSHVAKLINALDALLRQSLCQIIHAQLAFFSWMLATPVPKQTFALNVIQPIKLLHYQLIFAIYAQNLCKTV